MTYGALHHISLNPISAQKRAREREGDGEREGQEQDGKDRIRTSRWVCFASFLNCCIAVLQFRYMEI